MMTHRINYWSCSDFSDYLRRLLRVPTKPAAATAEDWQSWRHNYRTNHKFVYWFVEDFLDNFQDFIFWPVDRIHDVRVYIRNRFLDKLHYLPTRLAPGEYHELDTRLLHGIFEALVDFVECEKANMTVLCNSKESSPWWYKIRLFRWKSIRSRELGMKYLEWETTLDQPSDDPEAIPMPDQAKAAREIIALYTWWKDVRPNRPDAHDVSGWTALCDKAGDKWDFFTDKTDEQKQITHTTLERVDQIEQQYEQEDTRMLKRLIDIRRSLWT